MTPFKMRHKVLKSDAQTSVLQMKICWGLIVVTQSFPVPVYNRVEVLHEHKWAAWWQWHHTEMWAGVLLHGDQSSACKGKDKACRDMPQTPSGCSDSLGPVCEEATCHC